MSAGSKAGEEEWEFIGVTRQLMLAWFARHRPDAAGHTISPIFGEAERQLDVPRAVSINSVKTALSLDGVLSEPEAYLGLGLPPKGAGADDRVAGAECECGESENVVTVTAGTNAVHLRLGPTTTRTEVRVRTTNVTRVGYVKRERMTKRGAATGWRGGCASSVPGALGSSRRARFRFW